MQTKVEYSLLRSHSSRLITTAAFVNRQFWRTAYGSTPLLERLFNQRFILQLRRASDGAIFYAQNQYIRDEKGRYITNDEHNPRDFGDHVFRLCLKSSPEQEYITYHQACRAIDHPEEAQYQPFIQACEQGGVLVEPNPKALEKLGFTIEHVIHRPNHGIHHSMRVASYIPFLFGFFQGKPGLPDLDDLEKLQHMMLFSVVGREDEASFRETGEGGIGKLTAQRYRSTSGIAYLDYVLSREDIYRPEEKEALAPYRDALVVELMGFTDAALELRGFSVASTNPAWLKKRILLDTQQLLTMGTLTPEEAQSLDHAEDKDKQADELIAKIRHSSPPRHIVRSVLPEVFVHYIQTHYEQLAREKQLTDDEVKRIQEAGDAQKKAAVIRTLLPELMCDARRNQVFSFIDTDEINSRLFMMNRAHCMDLPRCYRLQQWHNVHVVLLNGTVAGETALSDWLIDHPSTQSRCIRLKKEYEGTILIFRDKQNRFFIQHGPDANPNYSEIKNDPDLINELTTVSTLIKLPHSRLLFHMADSADGLNASAQCFGEIQLLVQHCFEQTPEPKEWEAFKGHLLQLHDLLHGIESLRSFTGDRQQFLLCDLEKFEAFISQASIRQLFEHYKTRPSAFAKKLTSTLLPGLFDENAFQDYQLPVLFHLYEGLSSHEENPSLAEVTQLARMIGLPPKPLTALEAPDIPTIQSLHYDSKTQRMTLRFSDEKDSASFCQLYQERFHGDGLQKDSTTTVSIPLERYLYLRDNRYLKFRPETVPPTHSTEATLINPDTGEYSVLELVREGRALVRLHNVKEAGGKGLFEHEFDSLENPSTQRRVAHPSRIADLEEQKKIDARRRLTHPRTREPLIRNVELEPFPPPIDYQQPQSPDLDNEPLLKHSSIFRTPGGDKNTRFPKKVAYTLLDPEGRTQLYQGTGGERADYFPFGILCDLAAVHLSGERFIWEGRAMTAFRFWLGDGHPSLPQGLTLDALKERHKQGSHEHNELLVRASKSAICGFVTPKNTLIDRLNLVCQAKHIKDLYHIAVPLVILDPSDPRCPMVYTEAMIRKNLLEAIRAMRAGHFPYDDSRVYDIGTDERLSHLPRNRDIQNKILQDLLTLCGVRIGFSVRSSATGGQQRQFTVLTDPEDDDTKINGFLKALSVPGGFFAEEAQLGALSTIEEKDAFFMKQVALGHELLIIRLCQDYLPSPELYHRALAIAVEHRGLEFAKTFAQIVQTAARSQPGYEAPSESAASSPHPPAIPSANDIDTAIARIEKSREAFGRALCDYQMYSQMIDDLEQLLDNENTDETTLRVLHRVCLPMLNRVSVPFLEHDRMLGNQLTELTWMIRTLDMASSLSPDLVQSLEKAKTCVGVDMLYKFDRVAFERVKKEAAQKLLAAFQQQKQQMPSISPIPHIHKIPLMLSSTTLLLDYIVHNMKENQKKRLENRLEHEETRSLVSHLGDVDEDRRGLVMASLQNLEDEYAPIEQRQRQLRAWLQTVLARIDDLIPPPDDSKLDDQIERAQQLIRQLDSDAIELSLAEKMSIYSKVQHRAERLHLAYEKSGKPVEVMTLLNILDQLIIRKEIYGMALAMFSGVPPLEQAQRKPQIQKLQQETEKIFQDFKKRQAELQQMISTDPRLMSDPEIRKKCLEDPPFSPEIDDLIRERAKALFDGIMQPKPPGHHASNPSHLFSHSKPAEGDDKKAPPSPPDPLT